jgi:GNAT superfamily N-acetyltransferase
VGEPVGSSRCRSAQASVTCVIERDGRIAGYATVTAACVDIVDLPPDDRLRYPYPAPVLSLARLATDERDRGQGIGSELLAHVFVLAAKMADELGCVGVVVDSKAGVLVERPDGSVTGCAVPAWSSSTWWRLRSRLVVSAT